MSINLRKKTYISDIIWQVILIVSMGAIIIKDALLSKYSYYAITILILLMVYLIRTLYTNYTYLEDFEQLYEHYPYDSTNIKLDTVTRSSRSRRSSSTYYFYYGLLQFTYNNIEYSVRIYNIDNYYMLRKWLKDDNKIK